MASSFKFAFNFNSAATTDEDDIKESSGGGVKLHQDKQKPVTRSSSSSSSSSSVERVPVTKIHIDVLLKNVKKSIDTWSSAEIHFQQGDFSSTLRRIAHDEKPFDTNETDVILSTIRGNETDIIPGKYEGGLKVWECSIDLCHYLAEQIGDFYEHKRKNKEGGQMNIHFENDVQFALSEGCKIIELGCGHGLPACLLLKEIMKMNQNVPIERQATSSKVIFTDYNSFVLRDVTLPNILLNCCNSRSEEEIKIIEQVTDLYAGDWLELSNKITNDSLPNKNFARSEGARFDLILASETSYTNTASIETASWLFQHLKYDTGIGLVSMKRYYFGVGGGSDAFCDACKSYGLTFALVREYNDGASNIRDLWRVRLPSKS